MSLEDRRDGELIRALDWNELLTAVRELQTSNTQLRAEVDQLRATKLGLADGGTVTGPLGANVLTAAALRSPTLGAELVKPTGNKWEHSTDRATWTTLVTKEVVVSRTTMFLLIGHGSGKAEDGTHPLEVGIFKGSQWQGTDGVSGASDVAWGMGHSQPSTDSLRHTSQIVAMALCTVGPGGATFNLNYRARGGQKSVTIYGPSLWVIRLGDPTP
ncbi:hypothetical protein [Actinophytocola oryzae]|uniref:Uncharacterized protein n=1 Tax=Actinophytocola oryzae TaxID=502181 RepID=A0A4R7VHG6_9PSEU|nr:hypothetical protein [Actinophytocola oryzae]TDV48772.1 hypothetical protein CLV71_108132 [Actinophytocola oryzae]